MPSGSVIPKCDHGKTKKSDTTETTPIKISLPVSDFIEKKIRMSTKCWNYRLQREKGKLIAFFSFTT